MGSGTARQITRVPVSSTRCTRRRAQAGDGCGKSARQWPPRLSSRASAAVAISSADQGGIGGATTAEGERLEARDRGVEAGALAHHAQGRAHQGAQRPAGSGAGGSATGRGAGNLPD